MSASIDLGLLLSVRVSNGAVCALYAADCPVRGCETRDYGRYGVLREGVGRDPRRSSGDCRRSLLDRMEQAGGGFFLEGLSAGFALEATRWKVTESLMSAAHFQKVPERALRSGARLEPFLRMASAEVLSMKQRMALPGKASAV